MSALFVQRIWTGAQHDGPNHLELWPNQACRRTAAEVGAPSSASVLYMFIHRIHPPQRR